MVQSGKRARRRPDRAIAPDRDAVGERMRQRRWRILRAALPPGHGIDPLPLWVQTPQQFVDWVAGRLTPGGMRFYRAELEELARQTCDLELFRLARDHRGR
jgi:hypothetical protein